MNEYRITTKLMGCAFELIVASSDSTKADHLLEVGIQEIKRIEEILSEFKENSILSQINRNAGIKRVKVNAEVFSLLLRCQKIAALTQGAFDISVGPLKKKYNFKNQQFTLPPQNEINDTLKLVGFSKIILDAETKEVFLPHQGMHISFAAIGKGYAADCVKKIWMDLGVTSGVINASGDLTTIGTRPNGSPWDIGIANPNQKNNVAFHIPVVDSSVATSGDYEQFFIHKNVRYSHNINPITGFPVKGIKSVSIISQSAELSDALATAVYVMGVDVGMHLVNQLPHVHGIIIDDENRSFYSNKINLTQREFENESV
jgi:FAD:protein FMN transferase